VNITDRRKNPLRFGNSLSPQNGGAKTFW